MSLVEGLAEPLQEIDALRHEIKADCVNRVHLSAEIEHYTEKVRALLDAASHAHSIVGSAAVRCVHKVAVCIMGPTRGAAREIETRHW